MLRRLRGALDFLGARVAEMRAARLYNAINASYRTGDYSRLDNRYDALRRLAAGHPQSGEINHSFALAVVVRLLMQADRHSEATKVAALLHELRHIHGVFASNVHITEAYAMGLVNATMAFRGPNDMDHLLTCLDMLDELTKAPSCTPAVRVEFAKALCNGTSAFQAAGQRQRIEQCAARMQSLKPYSLKEEDLAVELADALVELVRCDDDIATGPRFICQGLEAVFQIHVSFPGNSQVVHASSSVLLNAMAMYIKHKNIRLAESCLATLEQTENDYRKDTQIAVDLAKGYFNLTNAADTSWEATARYCDRLTALSLQYATDPAVAIEVSEALAQIVRVSVPVDQWSLVDTSLQNHLTLQRVWRDQSEIALACATAHYHASRRALSVGRRQQGLEYAETLRTVLPFCAASTHKVRMLEFLSSHLPSVRTAPSLSGDGTPTPVESPVLDRAIPAYGSSLQLRQARLYDRLVSLGIPDDTARAAVDAGYLYSEQGMGNTEVVWDSFYGTKFFMGFIPLEVFVNYLQTGVYKVRDSVLEPKDVPVRHTISNVGRALEAVQKGWQRRYFRDGTLSFRGQTSEYHAKRLVPNPLTRDRDGLEPLMIPVFWRRFRNNWLSRFQYRPKSLLFADAGSNELGVLAAGGLIPLSAIHRYSDMSIDDIRDWEYSWLDPGYVHQELPIIEQHYGFPTDRLDLTFDLRIALFFATHKFTVSEDRTAHYVPVSPGQHRGVVYCFRFEDPKLKSTSDLVTSFNLVPDAPPVRPLYQRCALRQFDAFHMNEAYADIDAVLALDQDFNPAGLPSAQDLFPDAASDPFYRLLLEAKRLWPEAFGSIVQYDLSKLKA